MSKTESATKNNGWKFATTWKKLCAYIWIHVKHFYYICSNQFRHILQVIFGKIENRISPSLFFFFHSTFFFALLFELGQILFDCCFVVLFFHAGSCDFVIGVLFWFSKDETHQYSIWLSFWSLISKTLSVVFTVKLNLKQFSMDYRFCFALLR